MTKETEIKLEVVGKETEPLQRIIEKEIKQKFTVFQLQTQVSGLQEALQKVKKEQEGLKTQKKGLEKSLKEYQDHLDTKEVKELIKENEVLTKKKPQKLA